MRAVAEVPENHPAFAQPSEPTPPVSEVQTSAPVESTPEPVPEPEQPSEPVAAAPVEQAEDADEGPYFRRKDGTFRKATKKEALGEMHSRINTLTGRLRGTEEELSRVRSAVPARVEPQQPAQAPIDPTDPEPNLEQFVNEADPYKAYIAAQARWAARDERRSWERQAAQQQQQRAHVETIEQFQSRAQEFRANHPDYDEVLRANNLDVTPALHHVITTDENGPAIAYYLGSHPDEALALVLQTVNLPAAGPQVEVVRRLLTSRIAAAGSTGSARPAVRSSAPTPLNPVRTVAPALDEPPLTGDVPFSDFVRRGNDADRKRREARTGA